MIFWERTSLLVLTLGRGVARSDLDESAIVRVPYVSQAGARCSHCLLQIVIQLMECVAEVVDVGLLA